MPDFNILFGQFQIWSPWCIVPWTADEAFYKKLDEKNIQYEKMEVGGLKVCVLGGFRGQVPVFDGEITNA